MTLASRLMKFCKIAVEGRSKSNKAASSHGADPIKIF